MFFSAASAAARAIGFVITLSFSASGFSSDLAAFFLVLFEDVFFFDLEWGSTSEAGFEVAESSVFTSGFEVAVFASGLASATGVFFGASGSGADSSGISPNSSFLTSNDDFRLASNQVSAPVSLTSVSLVAFSPCFFSTKGSSNSNFSFFAAGCTSIDRLRRLIGVSEIISTSPSSRNDVKPDTEAAADATASPFLIRKCSPHSRQNVDNP